MRVAAGYFSLLLLLVVSCHAKDEDYYKVLGLNRRASAKEVRQRYRSLAKELHPDKNKAPGAAEHFSEVAEAADVLSDSKKRAIYDDELRMGELHRQHPQHYQQHQRPYGGKREQRQRTSYHQQQHFYQNQQWQQQQQQQRSSQSDLLQLAKAMLTLGAVVCSFAAISMLSPQRSHEQPPPLQPAEPCIPNLRPSMLFRAGLRVVVLVHNSEETGAERRLKCLAALRRRFSRDPLIFAQANLNDPMGIWVANSLSIPGSKAPFIAAIAPRGTRGALVDCSDLTLHSTAAALERLLGGELPFRAMEPHEGMADPGSAGVEQ